MGLWWVIKSRVKRNLSCTKIAFVNPSFKLMIWFLWLHSVPKALNSQMERKMKFNLNWIENGKWKQVIKIVFCYQNCSDLLWEKIVLVIEKNFWNSRLKGENFQIFEITRTIYSNSERSEQFLVTECFFNLFLEVSYI